MKDDFHKYPYKSRIHYLQENAVPILSQVIKERIFDKAVVICIGTDRCIGDSLGPLVGTMLRNKNFRFPVYGTLDEPIHAVNLIEATRKIKQNHPDGFFIAVDACLGAEDLIGYIHIKKGPISPGKGVGKKLPGVGKISVVGIVDKINNDDCFSIHNIRLNLVMKMAETIVDAFMLATYLS
ncbi:spore protease YyaC [Marinisporobacter balticus]|uniref:Putative sporulation protein YyaC n=1 Tax=Marinisporobacter balticus TaxID=2018667 RepID=A0A4V2SBR0_9FIRM|nr:spore protease YyaC [Marinisporobacter balticus]TCO76480.1 putative sporulation protein YyaC [Marinisporobacter balticus]